MFDLPVGAESDGIIALLEEVVDHALEPHFPAVVGRVYPVDAVGVQLIDLGGQNGPSPASEYFDVARSFFVKQVVHVFEKFEMPSLVRGDGDALGVFLDGGFHDFLHGAVVSQVDDLGARALQDAAHDIDRGVVPVEQRSCRHDPDFILELVGSNYLHKGIIWRKTQWWLQR